MKRGYGNKIAGVKGIRVGHRTITAGNVQTSVTVILPTEGDIFREKLTAPCHVIDGFGRTGGLIQLEKLGVLESPTTLTSTLCVRTVQQALVRYMLQDHPEISMASGAVSVVVGECNDGYLNDIRVCSTRESNVYEAIADAGKDFTFGAVRASRGMNCFEVKGGIGSASKVLELNGEEYTMELLILSNFGLKNDYIKENTSSHGSVKEQVEQSGIIIILATDIPMSDRQLRRVCKRMPVALARLGSHLGNGSGDIAIAFSITNKIPRPADCSFIPRAILHEQQIDKVFRAGIETHEEVIQSSLDAAETIVGREGHYGYSLKGTIAKMKKGQDRW